MHRGDLTRGNSADEVLSRTASPFWSADAGRATASAIALGDSVVVIQGTRKRLTVIWRHDGNRAWGVRVRGEGNTGPLLGSALVFTATGGSDGHVYAYRMESGRQDWEVSFSFADGPIALSATHVFVAGESGRVLALDRETGVETWRRDLRGRIFGGVTLIDSRPTVTTRDSIVALDPETGETVMAAALPATVITPPAVSADLIVFTSPDGVLFGLDRTDFRLSWSVDLGEASFGGAVIARDTVFATSISGKLWRAPLNNATAAVSLDLNVPIRAAPTPIRNGVLVGTLAGDLLLLEDTATPVWSVRVDGPISTAPVVDRGVLFVVDGRGTLHTWHSNRQTCW